MSEPQVVFGAGHVHITLVKDAKGNKVIPPQVIAAPAVQNISADFGKADTKMMYGQKEFAIHAAQGKKTTEVSFECGELYAQMLNQLYFGQSVSAGSQIIYRDNTGKELISNYQTDAKIQNVIALNLGKVVAHSSLTIKTGTTVATATKITDASVVLLTNQYRVINGKYEFSPQDSGKEVSITYKVLDKTTQGGTAGTSVVSTFNIPDSLRYNANNFSQSISISGSGLNKVTYSPLTAPVLNKYQFSNNGVLIFNAAQATDALANRTVSHKTDGLLVKTVIATLPAPGYVTIIDPPASALFSEDLGVALKSGAIAGFSAGDSLIKSNSPVTGEYASDIGGIYTFVADDVGAVVTISYITDFIFTAITTPDGDFISDKGVRNADGMPLMRVSLTSPLALLPNQYALDDAGNYYFDGSHYGDTVYIDYEYASTSGATLVIENNDMGSTPIVEIDLSGAAEGQEWRANYPRAIPKAFGFATKQDDYGTYKITYEVVADKMSRNRVGTVYLTS